MTTRKPVDPTKPVRTKSGLAATILKTDVRGRQPWLVLVHHCAHDEVYCYSKDGFYSLCGHAHELNLENIPEKKEFWANVYNDGHMVLSHRSKELADQNTSNDRIACIRVEYTEGEGL